MVDCFSIIFSILSRNICEQPFQAKGLNLFVGAMFGQLLKSFLASSVSVSVPIIEASGAFQVDWV